MILLKYIFLNIWIFVPNIPILTPKHVAQKLQIFLIREKIRQIIEDTHYFNEVLTKFDDFFEKFVEKNNILIQIKLLDKNWVLSQCVFTFYNLKYF